MAKMKVVYWSQSGNTEAMARAVAEGMTAAGAEVLHGEGVICQETPDEDTLEACRNLEKLLAQ